MVRFNTLRIRNANPFKSVDLDLRKKGLVRVIGRNGEGKSSLWHLMQFLFYGIHPNGATKSGIMLDKSGFLIESFFEKEGVEYVAATAEKSKAHSPLGKPYGSGLFLLRHDADGWKDISFHKAKGGKTANGLLGSTQKTIKDLLGWTLEEWQGYVYLGQQTVHKLIMGTRSERQKYLSGLFNLDPLDTINKHYAEKVAGFDQAVKDIERKQTELSLVREMHAKCRPAESIGADLNDRRFKADDLSFLAGELEEEGKRFGELNGIQTQISDCESQSGLRIEGDGAAQEQSVQSEIEASVSHKAEHDALLSQQSKVNLKQSQAKTLFDRLNTAALPNNYAEIMQSPDIHLIDDESKIRVLKDLKKDLVEVRPPKVPKPDAEEINRIQSYPDIDAARVYREIQSLKGRPAPPTVTNPEVEDMDDLRTQLAGVKATIAQARARRGQLDIDSASCPTCGSELNPAHRQAEQERTILQLMDGQAEETQLTSMLAALTRQRDAWVTYNALGPDRSSEIPELELQLQQFNEKGVLKEILRNQQQYDEYLAELKRLEELPTLEARVALYREKVKCREVEGQIRERDLLEAQLVQLDQERGEIDDKILVLGQPKEVTALRTKLETIRTLRALIQRRDVLVATNPQNTEEQLKATQVSLEEAQRDIGKFESEATQLEELARKVGELLAETSGHEAVIREKVKCEKLCQAYGRAGQIRELQLSKFTRILDDALTCHTFQHLPKHRIHFAVGDGISLDTSKSGCVPYDVCMMSGGEKGALSGALMFALDDMQSPDRRTSLKIIDELEAAFDVERKQEFLDTMLPALLKRTETVIVISHTPVLDKTIFDHTWLIEDGEVKDLTGEVREKGEA